MIHYIMKNEDVDRKAPLRKREFSKSSTALKGNFNPEIGWRGLGFYFFRGSDKN